MIVTLRCEGEDGGGLSCGTDYRVPVLCTLTVSFTCLMYCQGDDGGCLSCGTACLSSAQSAVPVLFIVWERMEDACPVVQRVCPLNSQLYLYYVIDWGRMEAASLVVQSACPLYSYL